MKIILKNISLLLIILMGLSLNAQNSQNRDSFEIQVDGLGCPFCAYGLEKKFKEFKGIKDIAIDIETGDFSFTYPAAKKLSMEKVMEQVTKAGYTPKETIITRASGVVVTSNINEKKQTIDMVEVDFFVNGKCGMCKSRIENTLLKMEGVAIAEWDVEKKSASVFYDPKTTDREKMEKALAAAGHDTKNHRADNADYENLPPCCNYKRLEK